MVAERLHTGPAAKPAQAARVDVWRLLGALAAVNGEEYSAGGGQAVCMNPLMPCLTCVHRGGRWCPPTERAARAEWDRREFAAAATAGS